MDAQEELLQIFKAEVAEVLEKIASHLERDAAHWDLELLFRWAHSLKGSARIVGEKTVEQIGHSLEDAFGAIRERGAISREVVDVIRQGYALLERIIYEPDEDLEALVDGFDEEIARSLGAKSSEEIVLSHGESASMGGTSSPHGTRGKEDNDRVASVRIAEEKIDYLSELAAGYLTVSHGLRAHGTFFREVIAGLNGISRRMPALSGDDEYGRLLERLKRAEKEFDSTRRYHERATEDFQWGLRQLRMMRIGSLRGLFSRTIREIARSTGKHAQLVIEGQDTEVDRVVLGSLRDSLVHLVRNAVAHGIESPEERAESRKPKYGTITLRARVSGSWVLLEIADDGRGVDLEAVRRRALESEALTPTEVDSATPGRLYPLLFRHGFSTAPAVDEIAGRGVGLDVVQQDVAALGGVVKIDSAAGEGTTVRIKFPLTRLTTTCIQVRAGAHHYLIPAESVQRTVLIKIRDIATADGEEVISVGGRPLPLTRLHRVFGIEPDDAEQAPVVILRAPHTQALLLDSVLGHLEVTLQPLSWNLRNLHGVAGAAVLDGSRVVPVLDPDELVTAEVSSRASDGRTNGKTRAQFRVLVVDDSVTSRTLLKNILSAAGYSVGVAVDGADGFARLQGGDFDLVITDVEMPGLDGFELTEQIRKSNDYKNLPVIVCTSLGNEAEKLRGATAGADAYIVKGSFDQDELLKTVGRYH